MIFPNQKNRAFTLLESLVAIAIFALAIGGLMMFILGSYESYYFSFHQVEAVSEAKRGIETMVKEAREAKQGDDGSYVIEKAEDYEFIFFSDIDKDGETERVRYFVEGSDFKKGVINPTGGSPEYITDPSDPNYEEKIVIISKYVCNEPPIFHYFDKDFQEIPAPARLKDTKLMTVYLVINVDPSQPPQDFVLESSVQLRNLKEEI